MYFYCKSFSFGHFWTSKSNNLAVSSFVFVLTQMPLVCVPELSPHVIFLLAKPALLSLTATPVPGHRGIQLRPPPASLSPATPNTSSPAPKGASTKPLSKPISKSGTTLAPTFVTPPQKRYFCLYSLI